MVKTISESELFKWMENSLKIALELGYDKKILEFIRKNTVLRLVKDLPPKGYWYGFCFYDKQKPIIEVYHRNLSTESKDIGKYALKQKGMSDSMIEDVMKVLDVLGDDFYEVYNQSGMDHEIIGHLYNHLSGLDHFEKAAVKTQIEFAKIRSGGLHGNSWKLILKIMPKVLAYHKGIDELK